VAKRLKRVCFNGKTAAKLEPWFAGQGYETLVLPSSSPANTMKFETKLAQWRQLMPAKRPTADRRGSRTRRTPVWLFPPHASPSRLTQEMLIEFFLKLKEGGVPASVREIPDPARSAGQARHLRQRRRLLLPRAHLLGEDEKYFDRFDRVFGAYFKGIVDVEGVRR